MLIGSDFDKIEFSFLGLDLLEPNAFIGDTLILITAITLGYKTKKINKHLPFFINWKIFFWLFGIGMFLGGIGHLMFNYFGFSGKYFPWLMGILAIYFVEKAMISLMSIKYQSYFSKAILIKLIISLFLEILVFVFIDMSLDHSIGLRIPAINSTIGFIFALGVLGYRFSKSINPHFIWLCYSVLIMLPSGLFIALKINIHQWFDKNDFGHLILILSMLFFYKSIKSYGIKIKV